MDFSDEEDTHRCGRCKEVFHSIDSYFEHKKGKACKKPNLQTLVVRADRTEPPGHEVSLDQTLTTDGDICVEHHGTSSDVTAELHQSHMRETAPNTKVRESSVGFGRTEGAEVPTRLNMKDGNSSAHSQCLSKQVLVSTSKFETRSKRGRLSRDLPDPARSIKELSSTKKSSNIMRRTKRRKKTKDLQCPECDHSSLYKDDFDRHLRVMHNLTTYVCSGCVQPFRDQYKLRCHQQQRKCKGKEQNEVPPYMKFRSSNRVYKHGRSACEIDDTLAQAKGQKVADVLLMESTDVSNFKCMECEETFTDITAIQQHVSQQHSITAGICPFCGRWFTTKYKLWRHIQSSVHDNVSPKQLCEVRPDVMKLQINWHGPGRKKPCKYRTYDCTMCKTAFINRRQLTRHARLEHDVSGGSSEYVCQHCNMVIKGSRKKFHAHLKIAHKLKGKFGVFPCKVCGKAFKQINHLERHWQTLHQAIPQGSEDARANGTKDTTMSNLKQQTDSMQSTNFCFVCFQSFPNEQSRKAHLDIHRVWRPDITGDGSSATQLVKVSKREQDLEETTCTYVYDDPSRPENQDHVGVQEMKIVNDSGDALAHDLESMLNGSMSPDPGISPVTQTAKDDLLICPYCMTSFGAYQEMYEHKISRHKLKLVFACVHESCKEEFSDVSLYEEHHHVHNQRAFICALCNDHFSDKSFLSAHKSASHRRENPRNFVCDVCKRGFQTKEQLEEHIEEGTGHFPCEVCGKVLRRNADLKAHAHLHKSTRPFLCELCGSGFITKVALKIHVSATHEDSRPHKCAQCQEAFRKKEHLIRHVKSKHSDETPFECDICAKKFKRADKLKEHQKVHQSEKPYICNKCGMAYRYREGLKYHEKSHEREKKFQCTVCPIKFPRLGQLKKHLNESHKITCQDQHIYPCHVCHAKFPRPERMKRHMEKDHGMAMVWNEICTVCHKGFAGQKSLMTHMKERHSKDKVTSATTSFAANSLPDSRHELLPVQSLSTLSNTNISVPSGLSPVTTKTSYKSQANKVVTTTATATTSSNSQRAFVMHLHPAINSVVHSVGNPTQTHVASPGNNQITINAGTSLQNVQDLLNALGQNTSSQVAGQPQLFPLAVSQLNDASLKQPDVIAAGTTRQATVTQCVIPNVTTETLLQNQTRPPQQTLEIIPLSTPAYQPIGSQQVLTSSSGQNAGHVQPTSVNAQSILQLIALNPLCLAPYTAGTDVATNQAVFSQAQTLNIGDFGPGVQAISIPYYPTQTATDSTATAQLPMLQYTDVHGEHNQ